MAAVVTTSTPAPSKWVAAVWRASCKRFDTPTVVLIMRNASLKLVRSLRTAELVGKDEAQFDIRVAVIHLFISGTSKACARTTGSQRLLARRYKDSRINKADKAAKLRARINNAHFR